MSTNIKLVIDTDGNLSFQPITSGGGGFDPTADITFTGTDVFSPDGAAGKGPTTFNSSSKPDIFDASGVILGTGWVDNGDGTYTHTPGNTDALVFPSTIPTFGLIYQIIGNQVSASAGVAIVALGDINVISYNVDSGYTEFNGPDGTTVFVWSIIPRNTNPLTITPDTDYDGTISISVLPGVPSVAINGGFMSSDVDILWVVPNGDVIVNTGAFSVVSSQVGESLNSTYGNNAMEAVASSTSLALTTSGESTGSAFLNLVSRIGTTSEQDWILSIAGGNDGPQGTFYLFDLTNGQPFITATPLVGMEFSVPVLSSAGLDATGYSVNGNAGASGTGTVISAITVENGIITAITVA